MDSLSTDIVRTAAFEIIEQCNFYCDFCVRSAHRKLTSKLPFSAFSTRLSKVIEAFPSLQLVALTGGEPFMHPELRHIIQLSIDSGPSVSITTNGSILDLDLLRTFKASGRVYLIISLDAADPILHDQIRGFSGSFDRLVALTAVLRDLSFRFGVNITVGTRNVSEVEATIQLATNLGASDISVSLIKPEGRGRAADVDRVILVDVGRQVERARSASYGRARVRFTEPLAHLVDVSIYANSRRRTCGAGGDSVHIQCDGNILLCTSCTQSLGNIDEMHGTLGDVWSRDTRIFSIRSTLQLGGACRNCPVIAFCGGCRCRAEKAGDFLGGDPLCPRTKEADQVAEAHNAVEKALARTKLDAADAPKEVREWLLDWKSRENFDRRNRDFLGQLRWGHDLALNENEVMEGEMGARHIDVVRAFIESGCLPSDLTGQTVLNIGPWTGGETLLLAALGARVSIVEEHPAYREAVLKLAQALRLPVASVASSLFDLRDVALPPFDIAYVSGVITHLTDPVIGMRILFEALKDGGICLLETQTSYALDGRDEFWGATRPGWVWWNLSRPTLMEIFQQVGFCDVQINAFGEHRRIQVSMRRRHWQPMQMRMGVSHMVGDERQCANVSKHRAGSEEL